MAKKAYEVIVVGCGGIGSAAMYWLSRQAGGEVLGIEQYHLGHDNGGSQDHSRIIRLSYHDPRYAALAPHTYSAWREVEAESGVQLVYQTGGVQFGLRDLGEIENYAASMRLVGTPFEELSPQEGMRRFPQFRFRESDQVLFQASDGLVDARKANAAHTVLARARGATILENVEVESIVPEGKSITVFTSAGSFTARFLILTSGAWTNRVLRSLDIHLPLVVSEEQVTYFATPHLREFSPARFPIWVWHGERIFYGFPVYGEVATKAGEDVGGDEVSVETRKFAPNPRPLKNLTEFLSQRIPDFLGPVLYTKPCLYTLPPDRDFILDTLPGHPNIAVTVGAGHAFKFASLIGKILSELALQGSTVHPIQALSLQREGITDPDFQPRTLV